MQLNQKTARVLLLANSDKQLSYHRAELAH